MQTQTVKRLHVGSVHVDFCGTLAEQAEFIEENKSKFPVSLSKGGNKQQAEAIEANGTPVLSAKFRSRAELASVRAAFDALGWDEDSQMMLRYKKPKPSKYSGGLLT